MIPNRFVAIDFGSTQISVMAAEVLKDGFVKILGVETKPSEDVRYGIIEQGSGAAFKLNELLKMLENSARLKDVDYISVSVGAKSMKNVAVNISRMVGASKVISSQLIDDMLAEAEAKVKGTNAAVYDVIPLYYELDGMRTDEPEGKHAVQIVGRYNIIYGNKIIAEKLEGCIERTGKIIEYRCLGIDAIATAVLDEHEKEEGCVLIDMGGQTTTMAVYKYGALQNMVVVPLGGVNITKDIQEFGIAERNAERLKCAVGKALETLIDKEILVAVPSVNPDEPQVKVSTRILSMAIEARLEDMMDPLFDAIEKMEEELPHGVILTGGASALSGLVDYINSRFGYDVRFGNFNDWLHDDTDTAFRNPAYTRMVGTILLNHEYREQHPLAEVENNKQKKKNAKLPGGSIRNKTAEIFKGFFGDDNQLE